MLKSVYTMLISVSFLFSSASANSHTILVTLAYSYLGTSICEELTNEGYNLVITGRNPEKLANLKKKLLAKYPNTSIETLYTDFEKPKTIIAARESLKTDELNGIVLIGPRPRIQTQADWVPSFENTFTTPLKLIHEFNERLAPESSIVIINGLTSKVYMPPYPNTNVLRLAWTGHVKNLAHLYGPRHIRVNVVSPGIILTPHHEKRFKKKAASNGLSYEDQLRKESEHTPLKRLGRPQDVAQLTTFLLSSKARHLNSLNIPLDGGACVAY